MTEFFKKASYWPQGKKAYLGASLLIVFAGVGWWLGEIDQQKAIELILEGFSLIGLRAAIAKVK